MFIMVITITLLAVAAIFLFLSASKNPLWGAVLCLFLERLASVLVVGMR